MRSPNTKRRRSAWGLSLILIGTAMLSPGLRAQEFSIPAAAYWAETGVPVVKGRSYTVHVAEMKGVRDAGICVHDLNGWPPSLRRVFGASLFWTRRRTFDPWFAVIATVDRRHPQRLHPGKPYVAPASGQLVCYFNDAPCAYGNNRGTAKLVLRR